MRSRLAAAASAIETMMVRAHRRGVDGDHRRWPLLLGCFSPNRVVHSRLI